MVLQTDTVDEVKVGIENLAWRMSANHLNKQGDDTLNDKGVAVGCEHQLSVVGHIALHPYTTLTAVYEVLLGFILRVEWLKFATQVNQQLVLVHPVCEVLKLLNDFVLYFVYSHFFFEKIVEMVRWCYGDDS